MDTGSRVTILSDGRPEVWLKVMAEVLAVVWDDSSAGAYCIVKMNS